MKESSLNAALRLFEAAEANLVRAEKVLSEIEGAIPTGIVFGDDPSYENNCRSFDALLDALPKIDGWKPEAALLGLDEIAQNRLEAEEVGEFEGKLWVERQITEPAKQLRAYRHKFNQKRRELIRDALIALIDTVDDALRRLEQEVDVESDRNPAVVSPHIDTVTESVSQIDALLGSSVTRPARWSDLHRHLHFGLVGDILDIIMHDWPSVKSGLRKSLYGEKGPIPVDLDDLGSLVKRKPAGPVATRLRWDALTDEDFERLIFNLIASEHGYENPQWLMRTNAPDRGRDLSVHRVHVDTLGGTLRHRVIIQCKHWQSKSISVGEVVTLREQMKLWEPPRVDVHVIATSGRFTSDAVALIEKQNQSDSALRVEMWPDSHLEQLLASRPAIIAEFGLR